MSATRTIPTDWAKDHWLKYESDAEHAERVERCEAEAGSLFARATQPQRDAYNRAMADLRFLSAPKYDRARAAAKALWHASTKEASDLYIVTCDQLMATGEVSEELSLEWDAVKARSEAMQAARAA